MNARPLSNGDPSRVSAFCLLDWLRGRFAVWGLALSCAAWGCSSSKAGAPCAADDLDGIVGGEWTFVLRVNDSGFSPAILKAQNRATVRLTLVNEGTRAHDFVLDCLATPNSDGCPSESCFASESAIPALEPGAMGASLFTTPVPEGIYVFRSDLAGDVAQGQFIVQ